MFYGKFKLKARQSLVTNVKLFHLGANKWRQAQNSELSKNYFIYNIFTKRFGWTDRSYEYITLWKQYNS